ncbi:hypothetical protein D3C80_963910 [compost metagenome]
MIFLLIAGRCIVENSPEPLAPKIPSECDSSMTNVISLWDGIELRTERSIGFTCSEGTASVRIVIFSVTLSNKRGLHWFPIKNGKLLGALIAGCASGK